MPLELARNRSIAVAMLIFLLAAFWGGGGSSSLASTEASLLENANACRQSLYRSNKKMQYRHNWAKCLGQYKEVCDGYPKSGEAVWALYFSARMYTKLYRYSGLEDDLDQAIATFKKIVESYPDHRLADDAQYRIGEVYYEGKGNPTQAYVEFLKVDIKFPSGDMRGRARDMMDELAEVLSREKQEKKSLAGGEKQSGLARVRNIRHWSTPSYTRVVVDMERPVKYESHLLKKDPKLNKPRRLYVDLEGAVASDIESSIPIRDGLLRRARAGQNSRDVVRVVLDIDNIEGYKIFHLHDPFRIVVDVRGAKTNDEEEKKKIENLKKRTRKGVRRVKEPDSEVTLARQLGLSVKRIVIDPGHGGKDPGCVYRGGIKEKDIVLKLAKILALKVEKELGCEAVLTRVDDTFLPLERRTAFANMRKGDLFISLHINAHRQAGIAGLETYFLNMATDDRAVLVAARENSTSEKNLSDLQTILNDLMLNTKISESSKLAHEVHQGMLNRLRKSYKGVKTLGVKQAPFYVLIGAEMPAILVETGFVTNPSERKRLLSQSYLESLADGIVAGMSGYIESIDLAFQGE
ncbi:MAG: N-acetylmuramoyl-L-alanine amidase [Deltaproteobacteria bacterium]|nr:N-acetylmuramoyl-L-alanine amidase [Deltaproteobacteria bacterium]